MTNYASDLPFIGSNFLNEDGKTVSEAWLLFLIQLWRRTGGSNAGGASSDLQSQINYLLTPNETSTHQLSTAIEEIQTQLASQSDGGLSELRNRLDELEAWAYAQNHSLTNQLADQIDAIKNFIFTLPSQASPLIPNYIAPTLLNGWTNLGGVYAPAGFYKDGFDIIRLRGVVTGGTGGSTIFQLPPGFRPTYTDIFPAIATTGAAQYVTIDTSGNVTPNASAGNLSFSGITFRVK